MKKNHGRKQLVDIKSPNDVYFSTWTKMLENRIKGLLMALIYSPSWISIVNQRYLEVACYNIAGQYGAGMGSGVKGGVHGNDTRARDKGR